MGTVGRRRAPVFNELLLGLRIVPAELGANIVSLGHSPLGRFAAACALGTLLLSGCGTTKNRTATEQLLVSSAVDQAVAKIDFRPLTGRTVYFDTTYIQPVKDVGFINAPYIISSLRQQMMAAGCRLQEKAETAEFIVEARVGAVGADAHEVTYGVPASNGLSTAAQAVAPAVPPIPAIPELAVAKRDDQRAAAKIAVFAYHRESRQALWQSGIAQSSSTAKDVWLLGAGPFKQGSIYEGATFAGADLSLSLGSEDEEIQPAIDFEDAHIYDALRREQKSKVRVVNFDEPVNE
jgi:hypothetical protein